MAPTPNLLGTTYDGNLVVGAQWKFLPDVGQYVITVYSGSVVLGTGTAIGSAGTVTLLAPVPGRACQVTVATNDGAKGPESNRLLIVVDRVSALTATYDGTELDVAWALPAAPVNSAQVAVKNATGPTLAQAVVFGTHGTLTPTAPLTDGATLQVRAAVGASVGPLSTLPLITARASVRGLSYDPADGARVQVLLAGTAPTGASPEATLFADGFPVASATGAGTLVPVPLAGPLDPATAWSVRPAWTAGAVTGPSGSPVDVLTTAPALGDVRVDDAGVALSWRSLPGPPYPSGGQVRFSAPGQTTSAAVVAGADGGVCVPAPPLADGVVYAVRVSNLRGVAEGPASAPTTVANVRTPVTATAYDGRTLTVAWDGADPAGTSGCRVEVLEGTTVVASRAATGGSAAVDVALVPGATHGVRLRWLAPGGVGPVGPVAPVLAATAGVAAIAVSPGGLAVTVAPPGSAPGVARYVARLFHGDHELAASPPVAATGTPVAPITASVAGLSDLTVRVQALGTDGTPAGSGPLGPPATVLGTGPTVERASLAGSALTLAWTPTPGATSATVTVAPATGDVAPAVFAALPGTTATVTVPTALLDPAVGATVAVTAVGPLGPSPAGPACPLLVSAPTVVAAAWDGARLRADWSWPQGAAGAAVATGYRVELLADGVRRGRVVATATPAVLVPDAPIDPTSTVAVAVNPLAPPAAFEAGPSLSVPWGAPTLQAAAATLDGHLALTFGAAPAAAGAVTGYTAVLSTPGQPDALVPLPGTTSPATIALPTPPSDAAFVGQTVALRATGPGVSGPASAALPVLRGAPAPTEATFDDGVLALGWSAVPEPADGYAVAVTDGSATVDASTPGTWVVVPLTPGAGAWRATVVARAGGASGPAALGPDGAAGVPLLLAAPTVGAVAFDASTLTVAVTAPAAPAPAATGYVVELVRDGAVVRRVDLGVPGDGAPLALAVEPDPDPVARHAVRVRARAGVARGPAAADAPVVLAAPRVARAAVESDGVHVTVDAAGLPDAGRTLQAVLVVDGVAGAAVTVDPSGVATLPSPPGTATSATVAARAAYAGTTGPWSPPVPLPLTAPVVASARYDGETLQAGWAGDPADRAAVAVTAGGTDVARAVVAGGAASLRFDPPAAPATLSVRTARGVALGPAGRLPLVTTGAAVTVVTAADGSGAAVTWTLPTGEPAATAVVPVVAGEGQRREQPDVAPDPATTTVPLAGAPADAAVGVRVRAGAALGPTANLAPVVLGAPTDVRVTWDPAGVLTATWQPPEEPRVDGALVTLTTPNAPDVVTRVAAASAWHAPLAAGVQGATVAVAAVTGHGTGPTAAAVPAIVDAPTLTAVGWDGTTLTATWTAVTAPGAVSGYAVTVGDPEAPVLRRTVPGTTATLTLPAVDGPLPVTVAALAPGSTGPASAPVVVPRAAPEALRSTVDPVTGATTVAWPAVADPPASGYRAQVYVDGAPAGAPLTVTGPSVSLPAEPTVDQALTVAVAADATVAGAALRGPYGLRRAVPTAAPRIADVAFDGAAARVRWTAVPGATAYAVAVVTPGTPTPIATADAPADATSLRLPVALPNVTDPYEVVVQARFGPSTGVRSRAPLFRPALVVLATDGPPRVQRAATPALGASAVVAYLPPIGALTALPIAPPQAGATDVPFTIDANPDGATAARFPYRLTIDHGALRFDPARPALAASYRALLAQAEAQGATAQGVLALQQAISRLMPQSFDETLYYAYGLSTTDGSVDLRPGTILRVSSSAFDLTAVSAAPVWSSGYAGGAVVDLPIGDYFDGGADGAWLTGFDAFLAALTANGTLTVPAPQSTTDGTPVGGTGVVQTGGSEAADLFFADFRQPYHRLLIPDALQAATPPGVSRTGQQFTIAAAATWEAIDGATATPGGGVSLAYFRGRSVLGVCVRVTVDGTEQVVPIGTTVGQLLDGLGRRPPSTAVALDGLRLDRARGPVVLDPAAPYDAAAADRVLLDWNGLVAWGAGRDALSLPVLHGDRLTTDGVA